MQTQQAQIEAIIKPYLLNNAFVYKELPEIEKTWIQTTGKELHLSRGAFLFKQGQFPNFAYIVLSGKVKIFSESKQGQRQTIYIYTQGDLLGYRQILSNEAYPVSAMALEDVVLLCLPVDFFRNLVRDSVHFNKNLLEALALEFSVWVNRLSFFAKLPVQIRLILSLLTLHELYRSNKPGPTVITLTRTDLAEYIGASLETVVRVLAPLKKNEILQIRGRRIELYDPLAMMDLLPK